MSNSANAYLSKDGAPQVRESVVGFFDILGFSQVSMACASIDDSQAVLNRIVAAIEDSRKYVRDYFEGRNDSLSNWSLKFFSDNLVLGLPVDDTAVSAVAAVEFVLRCAQRYQLSMAMSGYFVRGALTQGPICLTDEIIFGSALVESYQLESKASIVPRIVLTEPLQRILVQPIDDNVLHRAAQALICRDVDGWWFVNYLQVAETASGVQWDLVRRHKESILDSLSRTTRHDVLPKYGWACRYHNVFCRWHRSDRHYSDEYRIDRADEHSTIRRMES